MFLVSLTLSSTVPILYRGGERNLSTPFKTMYVRLPRNVEDRQQHPSKAQKVDCSCGDERNLTVFLILSVSVIVKTKNAKKNLVFASETCSQ